MGEGDRPYRLNVEGEPGALDPLNEDLLDDASIGGGNIADDVPLTEDIAGVSGVVSLVCPLVLGRSSAMPDSMSLVDSRWKSLGRLEEACPWALGVRLWR